MGKLFQTKKNYAVFPALILQTVSDLQIPGIRKDASNIGSNRGPVSADIKAYQNHLSVVNVKQKCRCYTTITHKISETSSSFHVK